MAKSVSKKSKKETTAKKRSRVSQSDIPSYPISQAIRIAAAIFDNYAGDPTSPLKVAQALDMTPSSGGFRMLTGASVAYGLTVGGYNVDKIEVTQLAKKILRPTDEGEDLLAKRSALLQPRIVSEFLNKYNNSPIPKVTIAVNVLEDMGAPRDRAEEIFNQIIESAESLGLITTIKDKKYVDLEGVDDAVEIELVEPDLANDEKSKSENSNFSKSEPEQPPVVSSIEQDKLSEKAKRVFITHGKNKSLVEPIKQFLAFGEMIPVVSVEKQSISEPVPEKVLNDMRSCGAAIIHVEGEEKLINPDGEERVVLNPNVLIEIGAAMALYKKRFILLVQSGTKLPSNLQGLFEVRYSGNALDSAATVNLLQAIKDMKQRPL